MFKIFNDIFKKNNVTLVTDNENLQCFCKMEINKVIKTQFSQISEISFTGFHRNGSLKNTYELQNKIYKALSEVKLKIDTEQLGVFKINPKEMDKTKMDNYLNITKCIFQCTFKEFK